MRLLQDPEAALRELFASKAGQKALDVVLAEFRKAGLASQVADVSVCGAVHPYSEILGGKLVTLLLASREARQLYAERYGTHVSLIASQLAGRTIRRPAELRILTTTSLYGVGSSHYNRLKLRADEHRGLGTDIAWQALGRRLTAGFGTVHLGGDTVQALRRMSEFRHDARRVNHRFGEGSSPRLRQIREGLDAMGIESDHILHHATPRIIYGCELVPQARAHLLGLAPKPNHKGGPIDVIARGWRRRWLAKRILRDETLERLRSLGRSSVYALFHADDNIRARSSSDLSLRSCSDQLRTVCRIAFKALSLAAGLNETSILPRCRRDSRGRNV